MYKKIFWSLTIIVIIAIGTFAFMIFSDSKKSTDQIKSRVIVEGQHEIEEEPESTKKRDPNLNPFCEKVTLEELGDDHYRQYIHRMSHQKITADEKRGFYLITSERIDWLLEGLNVVDLRDRQTYRNILDRWKKGDFSKADHDHNAVWDLLGGEVGIATGLMTPQQEEAYIAKMKKRRDYCP